MTYSTTPLKNSYFDEEEELPDWIEQKLFDSGTLDGLEADAFLASEYAGETHGNYTGRTLFKRASLWKKYKITVEKIKEEK